ncbi:UNVERIFIED_CONTAM: GMP reductase 1 [Trichonephila clavipes]
MGKIFKHSKSHGMFTCIHKHYTLDQWKKFAVESPEALKNVAVSIGTAQGDFEALCAIIKEIPEIEYICLDVANGYSEHFVALVKQVRAAYPSHTIMAGNVVTGEMVEELILSGADVIKVGIGPGSVCTTRKKTGVGYPQLSAVLECADAAHGLGGHIISVSFYSGFHMFSYSIKTSISRSNSLLDFSSTIVSIVKKINVRDGGCTNPGDVAKAFGAGADFVMIGGMFAGHDQSGGDVIEKNGKKVKLFYGMSSATAMQRYHGGVAEYRASEGKTVEVPYRGDIEKTVLDVLGGLRSACTYTGASKLKELSRRTTFIRVTQQTNEIFCASEVRD